MGLSRGEFFARVGLLREMDPLTDQAYRFAEIREAAQSDQGAAVDDKWHVSFHGSQFPGDDPKGCSRALLYRMMDIPRATGSYLWSNRKMTQIQDAGKDIEDRLVMKWHSAGYLLSPPPVDWSGRKQLQLVFEEPQAWLTSTVDAIVLQPRTIMPVVCEVKSKYADAIDSMKKLIRGPDEKHVKQIKTQIAMARAHFLANPISVKRCYNSDRMAILIGVPVEGNVFEPRLLCPQHLTDECLYDCELVAPEYGWIYYVSRDNPIDTHEFYVEYDPKFYEAGVALLEKVKECFIADVLPQSNFVDKKFAHPFGWLWGDSPCKWCDYGDVCRADKKAAIAQGKPIRLSESAAVEEARAVRADYDFEAVRAAVFERWDVSPEDS